MAQKPWVAPIPGTTQMAHMLENVGAADVRWTPAELVELNKAHPSADRAMDDWPSPHPWACPYCDVEWGA